MGAFNGMPRTTGVDREDDGTHAETQGIESRSADQRKAASRVLVPWTLSGALSVSPFAVACRLLRLVSALDGVSLRAAFLLVQDFHRSEIFSVVDMC